MGLTTVLLNPHATAARLESLEAENNDIRARLARAEARARELEARLTSFQGKVTIDDRFLRSIEAFGATVTASQASLATLASTLRQEKGRVIEANRLSAGNQDVMSRINAELAILGAGSRTATESVNGLGDRSRRIGDVLTLIRDVAEQSQILSLNATIEAARAGQAGKGFAVVANEVRSLATRTRDATAEIDTLVGTIERGTTVALRSMGELQTTAESLATDGALAAHDLEGMREVASGVQTALSRSALRAFVELAKVDHLVYKFEVYKVFTGASEKGPDDFASHRRCRLGTWYYEGEGHSCFARLDGYRDMEEPHLRVHAAGRSAVEALRAQDHDTALDAALQMEEASRGVLACLERMAAAGDSDRSALCVAA